MTQAENVIEAALVLDKIRPVWYNEIDLNKLNMGTMAYCIMGQLWDYRKEWPKEVKEMTCVFTEAGPFKFNCPKELWVEEILKRRCQGCG